MGFVYSIIIDKSVTGFKNRITHSTRTGYTLNWIILTGKEASAFTTMGLAHTLLLQLIYSFIGKGFSLHIFQQFFLQPKTVFAVACHEDWHVQDSRNRETWHSLDFQKAKLRTC